MQNELKECMDKLELLSDNFLQNTNTEEEKLVIELLSEVIVVEKETIGSVRLFNQLKENYFESDELTINFINGLYNKDINYISKYLDIYIEEAYEDELTENDINSKIDRITDLMMKINPELVILLEQKLTNAREEM